MPRRWKAFPVGITCSGLVIIGSLLKYGFFITDWDGCTRREKDPMIIGYIFPITVGCGQEVMHFHIFTLMLMPRGINMIQKTLLSGGLIMY